MRGLVDIIKRDVTEIGREDAQQGWIGCKGYDPSFDSRQGLQNVQTALGPHISCIPGVLSLEVRRLEYRERSR
jgi:hypothetical protein